MNGYMYKRTHNDSSQTVTSASGIYLNLSNGRRILDASCGAAVASIGHGNARVHKAMATQMTKVSYCHPGFFRTPIAEQLANFLVESTGGRMARACILGSGRLSLITFTLYLKEIYVQGYFIAMQARRQWRPQ